MLFGMGLRLARFSNLSCQTMPPYHSLWHCLAKTDSKTSIKQCTHSAPFDREEVLGLDFCNLLDQCFFCEFFRHRFLSCIERAAGNPHYPADPSDLKAFLVSSNCLYNSFLRSSFLLSTATSNSDSEQTKRALASLSSSKSAFLSVVVNGRSAGDPRVFRQPS